MALLEILRLFSAFTAKASFMGASFMFGRNRRRYAGAIASLGWLLATSVAFAADAPVGDANSLDVSGLIQLGAGDSIKVEVFGEPSMTTTVYVGEDGMISMALVGPVAVGGMTPVDAGKKVEQALKNGGILNNPHVTIGLLQSRSQRVAVLGRVHIPGRYTIDPKTTIFDLLAQAGGADDDGADFAYVLRPDGQGGLQRFSVKLAFSSPTDTAMTQNLHGGDTLYVPKADQFYIYGQVGTPSMYRLESGTTVLEAVARAGGITQRGSERRIEIKRAGKDGHYVTFHAKLSDRIEPGNVILVKESIF